MAAVQQRPQFTLEERVFMVVNYCETWSQAETLRLFAIQFPNTRLPDRQSVDYDYNKYVAFGVSINRNVGHSGRTRSARSPANVALVRQALTNDPTLSARRNNQPQVSASSFNRITRLDLALYPYRMERRHTLLNADYPRRLQYAQWLSGRPNKFIRDILIGDEAAFPMNSRVNTSLVRHYAPRAHPPLDFTYDLPHTRHKVLVWAAMFGDGKLIGPIFIDGNMNAQRYLDLINNTAVPEVLRHGRYQLNMNGSISRLWWLQDGAPCHTAIVVRRRLQELFPRRVVGIGHNVEWPPRSPDLAPLDFFLWGYVKAMVYRTPPANLQELRRRIRDAFNQLRRERRKCRAAIDAMNTRAVRYVAHNGGHVEGRGGR